MKARELKELGFTKFESELEDMLKAQYSKGYESCDCSDNVADEIKLIVDLVLQSDMDTYNPIRVEAERLNKDYEKQLGCEGIEFVHRHHFYKS